jgi:hypothetical protein
MDNTRFIVLRDGSRVSERTHRNFLDAQIEMDYWKKIVERWPDGSVVRIEKILLRSHERE